MNTEEVARKVIELTTKQAWWEAVDQLYADDVVSVEATAPEARGLEGVREKVKWWEETMEVHHWKTGPAYVARDHFVVSYEADITNRENGESKHLEEVGIYTVKDGKIVREEFLPKIR